MKHVAKLVIDYADFACEAVSEEPPASKKRKSCVTKYIYI